ENLIRIDCVAESPNVNGDDRALLPLPDPVRLAVQVEEPTWGRERGAPSSTDCAAAQGARSRPAHKWGSLVLGPAVSMVSIGAQGIENSCKLKQKSKKVLPTKQKAPQSGAGLSNREFQIFQACQADAAILWRNSPAELGVLLSHAEADHEGPAGLYIPSTKSR